MGSEISHDEASRLVSNGDKVKINKYINQQRAVSARLAACEEALEKIDAIAGPSEHADFDTGPTYKHLFRECKNIARAALKEPRRG